MATFTSNIPASGHTPANDQPLMEANYTYLKQSYGKDHNFTNTSNTSLSNPDGYHTVLHFTNQSGDPSSISSTGQFYAKTITQGSNTDQQLFFEGGTGFISQLTTSNAGSQSLFGTNTNYQAAMAGSPATASVTGGWSFLPGGLILNYGFATTLKPGSSNGVLVTYACPFPNATIAVTGAFNTSTQFAFLPFWSIGGTNQLNTFLLFTSNTTHTNDIFYFTAIGN